MKVELVIDRLSQLGEGVAEWDGRIVFVDGAFPGERVAAEVEPSGKLLRGRAVSILTPSPHRRALSCPIADRCGGCDWMALEEPAQREAKREIAVSQLEHIGLIPRESYTVLPDIVSPAQLGYRRRAVLHFEGDKLGYHLRKSHSRVAVERCPALVPALESLPGRLAPLLAPLSKDCEAVHLLSSDADVSLAVFLKKAVTERHKELVGRAMKEVGAKGAVIVPKSGPSVILPKAPLREAAPGRPGAPLYGRPDAFAQANAGLQEKLVVAALEVAKPGPKDRALELYCGNGAFTFGLAARVKEVVAVESEATSIELARRGAREGLVHNLRLVQGDAIKVARSLVGEGQRFELVLLDPPRTGARGIGSIAKEAGAGRVVYVACDAAALARDANELKRAGFRPATLQLVDMFPQTRHVEAVMAFERHVTGGRTDGIAERQRD